MSRAIARVPEVVDENEKKSLLKIKKGVELNASIYLSVRLVPVVEIVEVLDREQEKTLFVPNIDFLECQKMSKRELSCRFYLAFCILHHDRLRQRISACKPNSTRKADFCYIPNEYWEFYISKAGFFLFVNVQLY